jgi:hypothetical protein
MSMGITRFNKMTSLFLILTNALLSASVDLSIHFTNVFGTQSQKVQLYEVA